MFYRSSPTVQRCLGHNATCRAQCAHLAQWQLTCAQSRTFFKRQAHSAEGIQENTSARSRQSRFALEHIDGRAVASSGKTQVKPRLPRHAKEFRGRPSSGSKPLAADLYESDKSIHEHIGGEAVELDCGNEGASSSQQIKSAASIEVIGGEGGDKQAPSVGDTKDEVIAACVRWRRLYRDLSFPEDGDLLRARDKMMEHRKLAASFIGTGDAAEIGHRWTQLRHVAEKFVPSILAGCLAESAKFTLTALSCMNYIPGGFRVRAECLHYLQRTRANELRADPWLQESFDQQLAELRNPEKWPRFGFQSIFLDLLLKGLSKGDASTLLGLFLETYPSLDSPALLYVVDCYTRFGDPEGALSVLRRIPPDEIQRGDDSLMGRCIKLLRLDSVQQTESGQNFKILPALLELGVRPNALIHNIVIQNAMKDKLHNVAWDLYHYMQQEKLEIDAGTHLQLLKDSFLRQNVQGLNEIMSAIHAREDLAQNPYLVAYTMNIVRVICYFDRQASAQESLSHLLAIYDRAYDRAPLVRLGIVQSRIATTQKAKLPEPGPAGLAFTIWSYVLVQRQERRVSSLWQELMRQIELKNPRILEAARYDVFYSGFMIYYFHQARLISRGLQVLQHMLELGLCQPRDSTWSVAIASFLKHGHEQSAEQLRQMMQARGVEVTTEAWQFVLDKYAGSNIAEKVQGILDAKGMPEEIDESMAEPSARDDAKLPVTQSDIATARISAAGH